MAKSYDELELTRNWVSASMLNFTRYFFHRQNGGKRYIVGEHHRAICERLDAVMRGECRKLIINIAPRYGKTLLAVHSFIAMGLALNPQSRFIHLSYSSALAQENSISIKDIVNSDAFKALFAARVRFGSDTKSRWDLEQGGGVYATSTLGQITGFGAGAVAEAGEQYQFSGAIVIDDPIKPEDALSDNIREQVNRRFETTIRNRVNDRNTPIIIIMQRLHEHDLCGYLQGIESDGWEVLSLPCLHADGTPLWEFKHTAEELREIEKANSFVFETQYMQNPKPLQGLMYGSGFREYEALPAGKVLRKNYTDTADTGADYLCSVCYVECEDGMYVTDVLYTNKPMEYTEGETAKMLLRNDTELANIESNNGGRGFARAVEKIVRSQGDTWTRIQWFTQTKNKQVRIFSTSAKVQNMVYMPKGWQTMFPAFAKAVLSYRKEGGNAHDDAPDVLAGMVEKFRNNANRIDLKRISAMV